MLFASDEELRAFAESLRTAQIGKRIDQRQRTGSTNDLALQAARQGAPHGQVFIAEVQDAGRGRRGRKWECPAGLGLLFSVIVRPRSPDVSFGWISLATGLACAEAIGAVCGLKLAAKWPNDIVVPCAAAPGWRKLGGILCENRGQCPDAILSPYCVVLGIGLNLNHSAAELPAQTRTPPTSVLRETGRPCSRKEVLRATLERIEEHFIALHDSATSSALKRRFEDQLRRWWTADSLLTVQAPARGSQGGRTIRGRFSGLDAQGRLEIQDEHGRRRLFADVEVTDVRRKR